MTRLKAASTHLLISAILSALVISLLLFGWYPLPFFWALGGLMLLVLIVGIDVVLGPVMTLILFNPAKSRRALTIDLTLIAIVQLSALVYGLYSGYVGRLAFTVFDGKSFQLVQASEVAGNFLKAAPLPEYQTLPFAGYRVAGLSVPDDPTTQNDLQFFAALGVGPQVMPNYYVPLAQARDSLQQAMIPAQRLQQKNAALHARIETLLQKQGLQWTQVAILPFNVRTATYTAVVDLDNGTLVKVLNDDPG